MDRSVKQPGESSSLDEPAVKELFAVCGLLGVVEGVGVSMRVGHALYGGPAQHVSWSPVALSLDFVTHHLVWNGADTAGAVTLVAGAAVALGGTAWAWSQARARLHRERMPLAPRRLRRERRPAPEAVDSQARYMGRGAELAGLSAEAVRAKAVKLGVRLGPDDAPGVLIAQAVQGGQALYGSYEDLHLDIWGPRSGKTTSRVIPALMDALGAAVATSNKRDVVDATRAARAERGRVWVFDPQGVAGEECTWYWDPCAWVLGSEGGDGAQERAAELAGHFSAGGDADKRDAFFDPEGEGLLAGLILAAALAKRPITQVYRWVTAIDDHEPIDIVRTAGYDLVAGDLTDAYYAPDRQRGGVFSTAKKMAACLKFQRIHQWVCPPQQGEAPREALDVGKFVTSGDTLYPLSKEGKGSAGPLVTAMCAAVAAAGEAEGTRHRGGRLPVPLLIVLDEAANIVRWADLPKQYSHFGSRGMVVMTILQSWAQGVRCWGHEGMTALWSAANIKVLGAGLDDAGFLRDRSDLIGGHYELATSKSTSRGRDVSRSMSTSRTTETTLTASDLAALPKGRVVIFASGQRPTLGVSVPWMQRSYAAEIRAALDAADNTPNPVERLRVVPPLIDEDDE